MFLANEDGIKSTGCNIPEEPEEFEQVMAMMPMVTMMATNMNNGVEPPFMHNIKDVMRQLAMIFAVLTGLEYESEFCRGVVMAEEAKELVLKVIPSLMDGVFSAGNKG